MTNHTASEDRRKFLATCGRFALVTSPAMTMLMSTSLTSKAIAMSGAAVSPADNNPESIYGGSEQSFSSSSPKSNIENTMPEVFGGSSSAGGGGGGPGGGGGDSCTYDRKHHIERTDCPPEKYVRPKHWGNNTSGSKVFKF